MKQLFCDCKTDEEKANFFLSGRAVETGIIAPAISNDVSMAYHRCAEFQKEIDALRAKIEQMEKQEPVAWTTKLALEYGSSRLGFQVSDVNMWGENGAPLYVLPGAQPQLNEIRTALQRALELGRREAWTGVRKHRSWEDQREEQQCWDKVWSLLDAKGEEK